MARYTPEQIKKLNAAIDKTDIDHAPGVGGKKYPYVDLEYVFAAADDIFGAGSWNTYILKNNVLTEGVVKSIDYTTKKEFEQFVVNCYAHVRVVIDHEDGTSSTHEDVSTCKGTSNKIGFDVSRAYDTALKGSVTTAYRRAFRQIGEYLGRGIADDDTQQTAGSNAPAATNQQRGPAANPATNRFTPKSTPPNAAANSQPAPAPQPQAKAPDAVQTPAPAATPAPAPVAAPATPAPAAAAPAPAPAPNPAPAATPAPAQRQTAPDLLAPKPQPKAADPTPVVKPTGIEAAVAEYDAKFKIFTSADIATHLPTEWIPMLSQLSHLILESQNLAELEFATERAATIKTLIENDGADGKSSILENLPDMKKWISALDTRLGARRLTLQQQQAA